MTLGMPKKDRPKPPEKPVSLHPLSFEQAVEKLVKAKPGGRKKGGPAKLSKQGDSG